jgi:hypothetical protein
MRNREVFIKKVEQKEMDQLTTMYTEEAVKFITRIKTSRSFCISPTICRMCRWVFRVSSGACPDFADKYAVHVCSIVDGITQIEGVL